MFNAAHTIALAAFVSLAPAFAVAEDAPAEATVFFTDGQALTANIDVRSNDAHLVLRFESETATLLRRVAWDRVEKLRARGELLTANEAKAQLEELTSARRQGVSRDFSTGLAADTSDLDVTYADIAQHVLAD